MSRISKELAANIANKLVAPSYKKRDELRAEYEAEVMRIYLLRIPSDVLDFENKRPEFFEKTRDIRLRGYGFEYERVTIRASVVNNMPRCSYADIHLEKDEADILRGFKRKWEAAQEKAKDLRVQTEVALLACKTYKNIREMIPEAADMLPPPISNALVADFSSLRKNLNSQASTSEKQKG